MWSKNALPIYFPQKTADVLFRPHCVDGVLGDKLPYGHKFSIITGMSLTDRFALICNKAARSTTMAVINIPAQRQRIFYIKVRQHTKFMSKNNKITSTSIMSLFTNSFLFLFVTFVVIMSTDMASSSAMVVLTTGTYERLSSQPVDFMMTSPNGHRWIPHKKTSDAELWCILWSAPWINGWASWWFETTSRSLWSHCNVSTWIGGRVEYPVPNHSPVSLDSENRSHGSQS